MLRKHEFWRVVGAWWALLGASVERRVVGDPRLSLIHLPGAYFWPKI